MSEHPPMELTIYPDGQQSQLRIEGYDLSRYISLVQVEADAGDLTVVKVTLTLPLRAGLRVHFVNAEDAEAPPDA